MVTWVKFRDRATGGEFYLFNTHFDHQVQPAREKSAALVRQRVTALDTKLPVLLVGDFNAAAGSNKAYEILTGDKFFRRRMAARRGTAGRRHQHFQRLPPARRDGVRIDWILARGEVAVAQAETVTFARDGEFPSDHFPVVARLRLGPAK